MAEPHDLGILTAKVSTLVRERDEARAQLAEAQMMQKGAEYNEGCVMADLEECMKKCDQARAHVQELVEAAREALHEARSWKDERDEARVLAVARLGEVEEARAIARRLRARADHAADCHYWNHPDLQDGQPCTCDLAVFDALPWAKDDTA